MRPMNAYKDMLDNVVSPITCVSMNHQNQLEQMANGAMFATQILHDALLRNVHTALYIFLTVNGTGGEVPPSDSF
jgi:hypothetical protein